MAVLHGPRPHPSPPERVNAPQAVVGLEEEEQGARDGAQQLPNLPRVLRRVPLDLIPLLGRVPQAQALPISTAVTSKTPVLSSTSTGRTRSEISFMALLSAVQ